MKSADDLLEGGASGDQQFPPFAGRHNRCDNSKRLDRYSSPDRDESDNEKEVSCARAAALRERTPDGSGWPRNLIQDLIQTCPESTVRSALAALSSDCDGPSSSVLTIQGTPVSEIGEGSPRRLDLTGEGLSFDNSIEQACCGRIRCSGFGHSNRGA